MSSSHEHASNTPPFEYLFYFPEHEVKFCSFKTSRVPYQNCKSVITVTAELGYILEIPADRVRAKLPMPMSIHLSKMME